jgi:hypothetical protein
MPSLTLGHYRMQLSKSQGFTLFNCVKVPVISGTRSDISIADCNTMIFQNYSHSALKISIKIPLHFKHFQGASM